MKRGAKRRVSHARVVRYYRAHPDLRQYEIGEHFCISQSLVSAILRAAGIEGIYRGRKPMPKGTDLETYWEARLHDYGLGMDRGLRVGSRRIYYGEDPAKEGNGDTSVTQGAI